MAQSYGSAGQPPYPQQGGYYPQAANPYQPPPPMGWQNQSNPVYPQTQPISNADAYIEDDAHKRSFGFDSQSIRAAFIRKVFCLVAIMLTVVTLMCAVPFMNHDVMRYVRSAPALYYVSYGVFLVVYIMLICCENVRRSFPSNIIATALLTLSIGYMTMMICSFHKVESVLLCLIITTVCCVGIIIFSMQTKYDLTSALGFVCIISLVLMVFGIVAVIAATVFHVKWLYTVYAALAALLFMMYLAIDVQSVMGGKKYEISPEDYIFGAIQIFLDIVYIFWMLLALFGSR